MHSLFTTPTAPSTYPIKQDTPSRQHAFCLPFAPQPFPPSFSLTPIRTPRNVVAPTRKAAQRQRPPSTVYTIPLTLRTAVTLSPFTSLAALQWRCSQAAGGKAETTIVKPSLLSVPVGNDANLAVDVYPALSAINDDDANRQRKTVLMLHDFMTDRRLFRHLAKILQSSPHHQHSTIVAPDLRGFGSSSKPQGAYSHLDDLGLVLHAVQHDESIHHLHVVGCGYGGAIALQLALHLPPHTVRTVSLLSTSLPGHAWPRHSNFLDISDARLAGRLLTACNGNVQEAAAGVDASALDAVTWKKRFIHYSPAWKSAVAEGAGKKTHVRRALLAMARDYDAFHFFYDDPVVPAVLDDEEPLSERLHEVNVPVAVMVGNEEGKEFRAIATEVVSKVPDTWKDEVVEVKGCAHFLPLEAPGELSRVLSQYWLAVG